MGLPRYLKNTLDTFMQTATKGQLFFCGMYGGKHGTYHLVHRKILKATAVAGLTDQQQAQAAIKWTWRFAYNKRVTSSDGLTRTGARLYLGLEHDTGSANDMAVFREVWVPQYFLSRLTQENAKNEQRDRDALNFRVLINYYRKRVYSSRAFPTTLKTIIFERDNYTCKVCLRGREVLQSAGLHLECDHIVAWEDQGMTTYDNGQTICSACNKGKHHAKAYLGLVANLRRLE